jgi:hypothetical protein
LTLNDRTSTIETSRKQFQTTTGRCKNTTNKQLTKIAKYHIIDAYVEKSTMFSERTM